MNIGRRSQHKYRPTHDVQHRSTESMESFGSCNGVRIMTNEDFTARHPHPPKSYYVTTINIDQQSEPDIDPQRESTDDRQDPDHIDRRPPLTYRVQLPKIDVT